MERKMNSYSFPPSSFLPLECVQPCNIYSGSRFFSVFNSGPTFRRLYVTLYSTVCFFPG